MTRSHRIQIPEGQYPPESRSLANWQGREVNIIRDLNPTSEIVMVFDNCTTAIRRDWLVPLDPVIRKITGGEGGDR